MKGEFKSKKPFFMMNQDWYEYDVETNSLVLTNKAPKAAIDSYNDIYSSKNDIFSSNDNAEYKAAINEEIIRLSNDREAIELFGINLELLELKRKYEEIHNFPVIKNILDENVEINKLEDILVTELSYFLFENEGYYYPDSTAKVIFEKESGKVKIVL